MKRILTLIWILIITSAAYALDAPHNNTNTISCYDCHDFISQPSDTICLSCHINASGGGYSKPNAPKVITHSSENTSTKYGVWETKCRDCHRVHFQEQFQIYGAAAYLGTGTITSVTDNGNGTTTFGYSNFIEQRPGWSDFLKWGKKTANERGLILLPNLGNLAVNFEIFSAAANTITVTGSINSSFPGMVSIGNTFALIYGQNIRANAITPSGLLKSVSFFDKTGNKSFAYNDQLAGDIDGDGNPDDMIPDGICQVCHTNTEHFRSNGILAGIGLHNGLSGTDCSVCHKHTEGFSAAGACKSCHGFPPVNNALGGPDGLAENEGGTGSTSPGAHAKHATSSGLNYPCGTCHTGGMPASAIYDKIIQFGFNALGVYKTGNYDGRTTPANGYSYSSGDPGTIVTNTGTKTCGNIYCHGSTMASNGGTDTTPVWDDPSTGACGTCHGATAANPPAKAAHEKHTKLFTNRGHEYACTLCHNLSASQHVNNKAEVVFSTSDRKTAGGSYSGTDTMLDAYGDCSNIYCHSNVQTSPPGGALTYKTPNWGDLPFEACDGCHEGPSEHFSMPVSGNATGSHVKHAGYGSFPCYTCHASDPSQEGCQSCHTTAGIWPYNTHADRAVNVSFINAYGGIYSGTPEPGDAYGDCTNTYCHSSGKGTYTAPEWGSGAIGCNGCHGTGNSLGRPDYANAGAGTPNANSHAKHALSSSDCKSCHKDTTLKGTTINSTILHVNKDIDLTFDVTVAGTGATWTAATKTCSSVLCHGSGTPQWGATGLACQSCHLGTADVDNFTGTFWDNGVAGIIRNDGEWNTTGHGKAAGTYASGNPAAGFTVNNACLYCHDNTSAHKMSANPFRLRNITDATWGKNGACQTCHASGSAGITVDSILKNGSKKVGATHYGTKHNTTANGGQFCWDCHDPHGDSNIFMIHDSVAKTSDATTGAPANPVATTFTASTTGTDYAKSTSPFNGICNVCHTNTIHYTSASGDGHNSSTRCTQCHNHTGKSAIDAFGVDCLGCHSTQQGKRAPVVGQFSSNSHHVQGFSLTNAHCYQCHWEANSDGSVNSTYHGGTATSAVNLVIYGSGTRPTTYTVGTTSVEYTAGATGGSGGGGVVKVVDTWRQLTTSGSGSSKTATFTAGAGTAGNRMVIIGIAWEDSHWSGCNPSSITGNYGGQTITAINEANASNNRAGQWMGYVRETGIASKSNNTITLTFSGCTPDLTPTISVATYEGVDQSSAPSSVVASGTTGSSFSWSGLAVVNGGYALYNVTADGITSFTPPSGYTERYDAATANFRMTGGDKAITANGTESQIVSGNTSSSRWALVAVSVKPSTGSSSGDASRTELQKINQHCLGCHSAKNDTIKPFGDGKTPKQYAWDNTSIDARYSQTGTTPWGKYSGANVTPKNTQTKAYSAHGNASLNQRGWNTSETWPNTSGTTQVLCFDCHNSHGSTVTGTTASYASATANGAILKDTTANHSGYTMTYKPVAGGSTTTKNVYNAGAALCFDCHMTATAGTKPWGYQGTFGSTQVVMGYFDTQYFGIGATGPQQRYTYKASAGQIKGGHFGASSSMTTPLNGTIGGLCTPCHDPHGVSTTLGTNQQYGVPLLKGTWMTSPYKEDAAPQSKTEPRGGGDSRSPLNVGSTPVYHIDQNTFETLPTTVSYTWNFNSTKRVAQTVEQFAGLCLKCHPKTSIAPGTNSTWKSVDRIHNSVQGWGTFGGNNNNAVHSYTCSKCHAPHNSNLNRLMITNCLDFTHRGRVASGGTVKLNQQTDSDNEGRGNGRFPGGGGGYGREKTVWGNRTGGDYFFGNAGTSGSVYPNLRQCHDTANTAETWPNGERWNIKTPW